MDLLSSDSKLLSIHPSIKSSDTGRAMHVWNEARYRGLVNTKHSTSETGTCLMNTHLMQITIYRSKLLSALSHSQITIHYSIYYAGYDSCVLFTKMIDKCFNA